MEKARVLVIDDEEDILELVRYHLDRDGYGVVCAATGEDALKMATSQAFQLIVLDLMLPAMDGLEVTRRLKANPDTAGVPIVMLTAKGEESDIVAGLELGADDYITKPFSPQVLLARIRAVLRRLSRPEADEAEAIRIHQLVIHPGRQEVVCGDKPVKLTFTEFRLLHFLARRPGWVFTRQQIVRGIRGEGYEVTDRAVDVTVVGLRKKLGASGKMIETVRGVGYRVKD